MVGDDFKARFDGNARNGVVVRDTEPVAIAIELIVVNDEQQQKFAFVNTHHMTRSPTLRAKKSALSKTNISLLPSPQNLNLGPWRRVIEWGRSTGWHTGAIAKHDTLTPRQQDNPKQWQLNSIE